MLQQFQLQRHRAGREIVLSPVQHRRAPDKGADHGMGARDGIPGHGVRHGALLALTVIRHLANWQYAY